MPKTFPTDAKVELIVCENIRPDVGGKLSLMGFSPSHELTLLPSPGLPAGAIGGIPLGLAFVLKDGDGMFSGTIEIKDPAGILLGTGNLENIEKKSKEPNVSYINVPVLPVVSEGNYSIVLTLDDSNQYTRHITIKKPPAANSPSTGG